MSTPSPQVAKARATIAGKRRQNPQADVTELQRNLRALKAEEYISRLVDEAPPLSSAQRSRLAALLAPAGGGSDVA